MFTSHPSKGKYLDQMDRVMTQVDRITEDIDYMPVAAFIFRDKESDKVYYSSDIRYLSNLINVKLHIHERIFYSRDNMSPALVMNHIQIIYKKCFTR